MDQQISFKKYPQTFHTSQHTFHKFNTERWFGKYCNVNQSIHIEPTQDNYILVYRDTPKTHIFYIDQQGQVLANVVINDRIFKLFVIAGNRVLLIKQKKSSQSNIIPLSQKYYYQFTIWNPEKNNLKKSNLQHKIKYSTKAQIFYFNKTNIICIIQHKNDNVNLTYYQIYTQQGNKSTNFFNLAQVVQQIQLICNYQKKLKNFINNNNKKIYYINKIDNISNIGIYKDNITNSNKNTNYNHNYSHQKQSIKCDNVNIFFDNYNQQVFIQIPQNRNTFGIFGNNFQENICIQIIGLNINMDINNLINHKIINYSQKLEYKCQIKQINLPLHITNIIQLWQISNKYIYVRQEKQYVQNGFNNQPPKQHFLFNISNGGCKQIQQLKNIRQPYYCMQFLDNFRYIDNYHIDIAKISVECLQCLVMLPVYILHVDQNGKVEMVGRIHINKSTNIKNWKNGIIVIKNNQQQNGSIGNIEVTKVEEMPGMLDRKQMIAFLLNQFDDDLVHETVRLITQNRQQQPSKKFAQKIGAIASRNQ